MEVYEALTLLREKAVKDPALRNHLLETTFKRNKNITNLILTEKYKTFSQTDYRIVVYHSMF